MALVEVKLTAPPAWTEAQITAYQRMAVIVLESVARAELVRLAQAGLRSTKDDYIRGIQPAVFNGSVATITLVGDLPNMVESGWPGGDLRETLLKLNKKRRVGKDGRLYAYIPFTHKSDSVPPQVAAATAMLTATRTGYKKKTIWGTSVGEGMASRAKAHHATDLFAGMYRMDKTYQKAKQSTLRTFRTIAERKGAPDPSARGNQNPNSWMHPGITARQFFPQAAALLEAHKDDILATVPLPGAF